MAVRDGTLDAGPYGKGQWYDLDQGGVSLEIDAAMLTTVVAYLAQLEAPVMRTTTGTNDGAPAAEPPRGWHGTPNGCTVAAR